MIRVIPNTQNRRMWVSIERAYASFTLGIHRALFDIGRENQLHVRKLVNDKNKTGKLYHFRGRIHQASAPGEAPATRSGALAKSVNFIVRGSSQMEFGDKVPYGKFLEPGTRNIKLRSHIERTAHEKAKDSFLTLLQHVDREVKK